MARLYLVHPEQDVDKAAIFFEGTVVGDDLVLEGLYFKEVNDLLGEEQSLAIPSLNVTLDLLEPKIGDAYVFNLASGKAIFDLPGAQASTPGGALSISWSKVRLKLDPESGDNSFAVEVIDLEIGSASVDFMTLSGDLTLPFGDDGALDGSGLSFTRKEDVLSELPLDPENIKLLKGSDGAPHQFAVRWTEPYTNYWLGRIMPDFLESDAPIASEMTLSFLFKIEEGLQEIRLDWKLSTKRVYSALGVDLTLDPEVVISIIIYAEGAKFRDLFLVGTVPDGKNLGTISSDFAWLRELAEEELLPDLASKTIRELQPNSATATAPKPRPLSLTIGPVSSKASLMLLNATVEGGRPTFLRPLGLPLPSLSLGTLTAPHQSNQQDLKEAKKSGDLSTSDIWKSNFSFARDFEFPSLFKKNGSGAGGTLGQSVKIGWPQGSTDQPGWPKELGGKESADLLQFAVPAEVNIGDMTFSTDIPFGFDWESFAVNVNHPTGIDIKVEMPSLTRQHLGLNWKFNGVEVGEASYHLFTLVTKDFDYQIQLAPGAEVYVEYTKASVEPIRFKVSQFAITGKGLTLEAEVTGDPARLNGINTSFRFEGSRLNIVENVIQDFTLRGAGPLPPDLVGEAMVDIALQFGRKGDDLTLLAGSAKMRGNKLLDCKGTRFQFSVDAVGMQFVDEDGFHLYFTLTGKAQFVLSKGDDKEGALGKLPGIEIELIECPLTGDASVIAKHVKLVVEFPKPISFRFLAAYEMELKAIGFIPSFEPFDGDACMQITGQVKFAQGKGDRPSEDPEYHTLSIGLPAEGDIFPRIHFENLPLSLQLGNAVKINGVLDFVDTVEMQGFQGEGQLEIQGLPPMAAAFAFMRVWSPDRKEWLRAWFVYLEASQMSLEIPKIRQFIREIGLGFGYRYTLVSIRAADDEQDIGALIGQLRELSLSQGNLASLESWIPDLERAGQDPKWTIVLRAMMAQNSASKSPLVYDKAKEEKLSNVYLLDALVAFRSDLTFYMAVRGWIHTNYNDYVENLENLRVRPIISGFVLYSVRRKRFLAHVASNPGGYLGNRPELPPQLQKAIQNSQFSATLLVEPGLTHFEMGWPNMLRWNEQHGPLTATLSGGFIFRVTDQYTIIGISFLALGTVHAEAEREVGAAVVTIGARVIVHADINFGGRMMALLTDTSTTIYAGLGLEIRATLTVVLWLQIDLLFFSIDEQWSFELNIGVTARLELGINGTSASQMGLRGSATVSVGMMGHSIQLDVEFKHQEGQVQIAYNATAPYLKMGLEASDADALPAIEPSGAGGGSVSTIAAPPAAMAAAPGALGPAFAPEPLADGDGLDHEFKAPDYHCFVIRPDSPMQRRAAFASAGPATPFEKGEAGFFVLLPQGEREDGTMETGFLPSPPEDGSAVDFELTLPDVRAGDDFKLWHYNPIAGVWDEIALSGAHNWSAKWEATVVGSATAQEIDEDSNRLGDEVSKPVSLAQFITRAFINEVRDGKSAPIGDPEPIGEDSSTLEDERVHNPTDDAFEAAVRGASEQFRGSPYFKPDPDLAYDQALERAFSRETSLYTPDGKVPDPGSDSVAYEAMQESQQAHQLRGVIVKNIIGDLQSFAGSSGAAQVDISSSIPFQLGLVFAYTGDPPAWLTDFVADDATPKIRQRTAPDNQLDHTSNKKLVRAFNPVNTDFSKNVPRFERVRHYTDAASIAIAWDLDWSRPLEELSPDTPQADPEHHLMHYEVRRRSLAGQQQEVVYHVKTAQVLQREGGSLLNRLKPRFQIVDHFSDTVENPNAVPATGLSYLYTITPVDFNEQRGRPLSLVATRYPNQPAPVPVDGELTVRYDISREELERRTLITRPGSLRLVSPSHVRVAWSEPAQGSGPIVAVREYLLVFRRDKTLPIGSYGLDSSTQRSKEKALPTSNARPLPTDIKIRLDHSGPREARSAEIDIEELQDSGVYPAGDNPRWRPDSWQVFFQTISTNGVPSALAPVQLVMDIADGNETSTKRRPAGLEWLPYPVIVPMLPPEDMRARPGVVHVPTPAVAKADLAEEAVDDTADNTMDAAYIFKGAKSDVAFAKHPATLRMVRIRWNQGPSEFFVGDGQPAGYPIDILAGYDILKLDVDAYTSDTFENASQLSLAVRPVQEVQMLPAEDVALEPNSTLSTNLWEAWYPSHVLRRQAFEEQSQGTDLGLGSWYSWRESLLTWPVWPGLTDGDHVRAAAMHPYLEYIVGELAALGWTVDLQVSPPAKPADFAGFLKATAPESDPYGWGVLQRFGLSIALSLRHTVTNEPLSGKMLLKELDTALISARDEKYDKHLHVELLFQPGASIAPGDEEPPDWDDLLATVQLSLRPLPVPHYSYRKFALVGAASEEVDLTFGEFAGSMTLINQSVPEAPPLELESGASTTVRLAITGEATVLLRGRNLPQSVTAKYIARPEPNSADERKIRETAEIDDLEELDPTDSGVTRFAPPESLAQSFRDEMSPYGTEWLHFKRYAEALSSKSAPDNERIKVPTTGLDQGPVLSNYLAWSRRFFDHCRDLTMGDQSKPGLATAYPQPSSPAASAVDKNGRLKYDVILSDRWAHAFRYYIRPYGRYDKLWHAIEESFGQVTEPGEPLPELDLNAGGLDTVLERLQPVSAPVVLNSGRLDAPATKGGPARPGKSWEVVVAQHPEQALVERNRTLARQLAYRHISFTLLRRFAEPGYFEKLKGKGAVAGDALEDAMISFVGNNVGSTEIPPAYPAEPDHLPLEGDVLDADEALSLDLPERIGTFQQGALVLQWEALPFYYEHRLLLVAQTDSTVSAVNRVTQRDFEYETPAVEATGSGVSEPDGVDRPEYVCLQISLGRYWDSLPDEVKKRWPQEAPRKGAPTGDFMFSELPDPGVSYQLYEKFSDNLEIQSELSFDLAAGAGKPICEARQLGNRFRIEIVDLRPPDKDPYFTLRVKVEPIAEFDFGDASPARLENAPVWTRGGSEIRSTEKKLQIVGVVTEEHRSVICTLVKDRAAELKELQRQLEDAYQSWTISEPISGEAIDALAEAAGLKVSLGTNYSLVWEGAMSEEEEAAFGLDEGEGESPDRVTADSHFNAAIRKLVKLATESSGDEQLTTVPLSRGLDQVPAEPETLKDKITIHEDDTTGHYKGFTWSGVFTEDEEEALVRWAQIPEFLYAVNDFVNIPPFEAALEPLEVPEQREIPASIRNRLTVEPNAIHWEGKLSTQEDVDDLDAAAKMGGAVFQANMLKLISAISTSAAEVSLATDEEPPIPASKYDIGDQLSMITRLGERQLAWNGSTLDAELESLLKWAGDNDRVVFRPTPFQPEPPTPFSDAARILKDELVEKQWKQWPESGESMLRPDQDFLEGSDKFQNIQEQLTIEQDRIIWRGHLRDVRPISELVTLRDEAHVEDQAFRSTVNKLIDMVNERANSGLGYDFRSPIPKRPHRTDLPELLRDKLLIGRALASYHGIMDADDTAALLAREELQPLDGRALRRLYYKTVARGLRNNGLLIGARRGSASPSEIKPIRILPLD